MSSRYYKNISSPASFFEARELGIGHLLIQGDSGGETFLTCPIRSVECASENLFLLMLDLESLSQAGVLSGITLDDEIPTAGYDAWIICAEFDVGESYQGGEISDELWLNTQFENHSIAAGIRLVLLGEMDQLPSECMSKA